MQTTETKCLVCELEEGHSPSELEEEAIAEHEWRVIKIQGKHFCPNTLTRCETQEDWEEMDEETSQITAREYLVKDGKKWKIMLKDMPKK